MIPQIRDTLTNICANTNFKKVRTVGCRIVCLTAATEMALRAINDLYQVRTFDHQANTGPSGRENWKKYEQYKKDLSADIGGAVFYGLCGMNVLPYTAPIGTAIFAGYSLYKYSEQNAYFTSRCIGKPVEWFHKRVITPICNHVVEPIYRKVVKPIITLIGDIANSILKFIGSLIKIRLPKHPIWWCVAALCLAVATQKVFFPNFNPVA